MKKPTMKRTKKYTFTLNSKEFNEFQTYCYFELNENVSSVLNKLMNEFMQAQKQINSNNN